MPIVPHRAKIGSRDTRTRLLPTWIRPRASGCHCPWTPIVPIRNWRARVDIHCPVCIVALCNNRHVLIVRGLAHGWCYYHSWILQQDRKEYCRQPHNESTNTQYSPIISSPHDPIHAALCLESTDVDVPLARLVHGTEASRPARRPLSYSESVCKYSFSCPIST